jgi:hypothetical protein
MTNEGDIFAANVRVPKDENAGPEEEVTAAGELPS